MGRACSTYIRYSSEYSLQFQHSGVLFVVVRHQNSIRFVYCVGGLLSARSKRKTDI